jgi:hypothetical protein
MKYLILSALGMIAQYSFSGGHRTAEDILNQRIANEKRYILNPGSMGSIVIEMSYGKTDYLTPAEKQILEKAQLLQVHLVYTDYPKNEDFMALNRSRIKVVENVRPSIVSDTLVKWKLIRQTDCNSEEEAKGLFHGIVIFYRITEFREEVMQLNTFIPSTLNASDKTSFFQKTKDSTVFHVLNEKKWSDFAVIADFTSSMYPYSTQVLMWFLLNTDQQKISDIIFFNDGDLKPDDKKVDGTTGGLYYEHSVNFKDVRNLAFRTANNGIGGDDLEENDLEAILYAMKKAPDVKEYVLIADNNAPPRDMSLLSKIKKPVHVILCGTNGTIELAYLKLARATGGSIHTMEEDLENIASMKEGQEFEFNGVQYKIEGGKIIELSAFWE